MIAVLAGERPLLAAYESAAAAGHRLELSSPALYEWLRGPRLDTELQMQRRLLPDDQVVPFTSAEASIAAQIYRQLKRGRGREMDIAIAACSVEHGALLWTVNPDDFKDIPGLRLYVAPPSSLT